MKLSCNKQVLVEAVSIIQRAVSTKSSIPALEGILIKTTEQGIELCGYNLELGMKTTIKANIAEPGKAVLSAKLFGEIVRRLPADDVHLTTDESNITVIQSGPSEFSLVGIPAEEYPELPAIPEDDSIEIKHSLLKSMIKQTIYAVADNDSRPIHTGTLFELKKNQINLVSVDGYRLAYREESIQNDLEISFVVPGKTLSEILKLLNDDDTKVNIHIGRRHIMFQINGYFITSRLLEGQFLDYHSAIPKNHDTEVVVQTRTIIDSIERVSLLIMDRLKSPIRCVIEEDEIKLSCSTPIGRANDQFEVKMEGDPLEIGFNSRFLLDALRNAEGDEIRILFSGQTSPMIVRPKEGNSFLFLVLPVRLKSE